MVRETLGEDAVIVATREERGGAAVRVTAAIDPAFEVAGAKEAARADEWLQYDDEQDDSAVAEELTDAMLRHNTPEDVMDNIISCATVVGMENTGVALVAALEHLFVFRPLPRKAYKKALMMVGPPGAGKTLVAAKLAARSVMSGLKVAVISTDTVRAGGIEQLAAFTKLLKIKLKTATNPNELHQMLGELRSYDQIIIDTAATNPFDTNDVKALAQMIGSEAVEPLLVLPAGIDAYEAGEMARVFSTIGAHTLVPTRIDMARRMGSILAAAHSGNMALADAGNTPKVANGLSSLTPETFAKLLMPSAYRESSARGQQKTGT